MVLHLDAVHTDVIAVTDPSTGMVLDTIPCGGPTEADRLVRAARNAQRIWRRLAPAHRAHALKDAALALRAHCDELAELQTREGGKPIADSRGGVMAGITTIEQYAELGPLHRGKALCGQWESTDLMVHEPRGVAAVLTPWNDPIAIACQGIAANLVVGNAVVIKPSERTPLPVTSRGPVGPEVPRDSRRDSCPRRGS